MKPDPELLHLAGQVQDEANRILVVFEEGRAKVARVTLRDGQSFDDEALEQTLLALQGHEARARALYDRLAGLGQSTPEPSVPELAPHAPERPPGSVVPSPPPPIDPAVAANQPSAPCQCTWSSSGSVGWVRTALSLDCPLHGPEAKP